MYKLGTYNRDNRMSDLVCDNYPVLLVMSRFGIVLGFGDKSIGQVCDENGVHTDTFLAVVNLLLDEGDPEEYKSDISVGALLGYLHNSHDYFLNFRLPAIRRNLLGVIDCGAKDIAIAILRFFDEYVAEVQKHMRYEERTVFPYVTALLNGVHPGEYSIAVFRKRHDQVEAKLTELKNILIKYYPATSSNELNSVLFDIFTCEQDLASHNYIEDYLFVPAIQELENQIDETR
ncbi:hemerythrin domain-containing protein [uncultured Barnesiella sp.]|uniref:hemerythrin domain-containing protein n=1 Tax=uncultured Barnesiella sp. TaxID=584861 RepID=UPI00262CA401|nr:hemerythrin domain-containing protein [uncultured Barnesiella sp.]